MHRCLTQDRSPKRAPEEVFKPRSAIELFVLRICAEAVLDLDLFRHSISGLRNQWFGSGYRDWTSQELLGTASSLQSEGLLQPASDHKESQRKGLLAISAKGISVWEREDKPNWNYYFRQRWRDIGGGKTKLFAACGSMECQVEMIGSLLQYYGFSKQFGMRQFCFKTITGWKATYWKTLDKGHCFSCIVSTGTGIQSPPSSFGFRQYFNTWKLQRN